VTIEITRGYDANGMIVYNKREIKRKELDQNLKDVARTSKKTPIIIRCTLDSPHKALVDVLDICYRNQLYSVSIFTL
jgi:biopolymer transport protein ExbD